MTEYNLKSELPLDDLAKVKVLKWVQGVGLEDVVPSHPSINQHDQGMLIMKQLLEIKRQRIAKPGASDFAWVMIPQNDTMICKGVLELVCPEKQANRILIDDEYWPVQARETVQPHGASGEQLVAAPFMDPMVFDLQFDVCGEDWRFVEDSDSKIPKTSKDSEKKFQRLATQIVYVPYLHFDELERYNNQGNGPYFHPRRSLDEAGYSYNDKKELDRRNRDQVIMKNMNSPVNPLLVVDQLWLWKLDKRTLVSSFPESPGEGSCTGKCQLQHVYCLSQEQANAKPGSDMTSHSMGGHIIYRCCNILSKDGRARQDLRFIDIFRMAIANERAASTNIFRSLDSLAAAGTVYEKPSAKTRPTREILRIVHDQRSIGEVRDIHEELHMIINILELQLRILETAGHRKTLEHVNRFRETVENLAQRAHDVEDMLFKTLQLKQTHITMRQGDVFMTFTVVTIVFLPLGFITSVFGMNAAELSDGSFMKIGTIFAYLFPISIAVSVVFLLFAFGLGSPSTWKSPSFDQLSKIGSSRMSSGRARDSSLEKTAV